MKVTRNLRSNTPQELAELCKVSGFIRADIWRRYGGIKTQGKSTNTLVTEISSCGFYKNINIDPTTRNAVVKDTLQAILSAKESAKVKVRQAIYQRTSDRGERQRLYGRLKKDDWLSDPFLHRQMRKYFKHGVSGTSNQFIVRSDKHTEEVIGGLLTILIHIPSKYGKDIRLITSSTGKHVNITRKNLRVIVRGGFTEIQYVIDKEPGRPCGTAIVGVDKGYTESFTDSDGQKFGEDFGRVMTVFSDKTAHTGKMRSNLYTLEKKYRASGNIRKAENIIKNNLGSKKIQARRAKTRNHLKTVSYKAVHRLVDKASSIISEDLTVQIKKKNPWKKYNRHMSGWAKGILAESLASVTEQRKAKHTAVNASWTSQMDSFTGLLEGKRVGDKFYRTNGDVIDADTNAARNILARAYDREITRFMPYLQVKQILLSRSSPAQMSVNRLELEPQVVNQVRINL